MADRAVAQARSDLLTPVVKAFASDIGVEVTSLGIQVHGGMGYVEETGAAQHWRDSRIAPIYEGTNGIQAIDLVTRKVGRDEGGPLLALIEEMDAVVDALGSAGDPRFGHMPGHLHEAVAAWAAATTWLLDKSRSREELLSAATPYLRLFGTALGGALLGKGILSALSAPVTGDAGRDLDARVAVARFYAETIAVLAGGLGPAVTQSADAVRFGHSVRRAASP